MTSPAEPPPVVAPEPSAEWKFEVTGYFRAPLRFSWGPATTSPGIDPNTGDPLPPSLAGTQLRTPPLVPDANYINWTYTNSFVAPWTELNFKYGNDRVKAQVQIASYNLTDPGYRRLEANLGINQAFITLLWPELGNNENLHLTLTVGGFTNRYGAAGRYDAGKYETYLFGRTHVAGATVNIAYDAGEDWTFQVETGGGAKLEPIPFYGAPGPSPQPSTSLPMWEPYPGPRPQESAFVAHAHLGAVFKRQWIFGAHFIDVFANDNEESTAYTGKSFNTFCTPSNGVTPPAVCGRPYNEPKPRIMIYGFDIKQLHQWIGDGYAGLLGRRRPERDLPGRRDRGDPLVRRLAAARQLLRSARRRRHGDGQDLQLPVPVQLEHRPAAVAPAGVLGPGSGPDHHAVPDVQPRHHRRRGGRQSGLQRHQQDEVRRRGDVHGSGLAGRRVPLRQRPARPGPERLATSRCSHRG